MDFGIFFDVFDDFPVRTLTLRNLGFDDCMEDLHVFTFQKNKFQVFPNMFRYLL